MSNTIPASACCQIHARGLNFRVFDQGDGVPVLLLHGFPDSLDIWSDVIPYLLDAGHRVIAFDQRGYCGSDMPEGTANYRIQEIIDDIPAVLDALGVEGPVHVMGHDWGGAIAWAFTLTYPQRVRALVAVSFGHPTCYGKAGLKQKLVSGFYTLWVQLPALSEGYMLQYGGLARLVKGAPELDEIVRRMSIPGRLTAALNWYRANLAKMILGSWPRCIRPTMGVWSDGDVFLVERQMTDSQNYVDAPWAYERFYHCGHWIPKEQPERLAHLAVDWFAKNPD